jgi:hypothetical protein
MLHTEKKDREREREKGSGEWKSKEKGGRLEPIQRTTKQHVFFQHRQSAKLFLQSSSELGPPRPQPQAIVSPLWLGGRAQTCSLAGERMGGGGGGPSSDEGTDTVVL